MSKGKEIILNRYKILRINSVGWTKGDLVQSPGPYGSIGATNKYVIKDSLISAVEAKKTSALLYGEFGNPDKRLGETDKAWLDRVYEVDLSNVSHALSGDTLHFEEDGDDLYLIATVTSMADININNYRFCYRSIVTNQLIDNKFLIEKIDRIITWDICTIKFNIEPLIGYSHE